MSKKKILSFAAFGVFGSKRVRKASGEKLKQGASYIYDHKDEIEAGLIDKIDDISKKNEQLYEKNMNNLKNLENEYKELSDSDLKLIYADTDKSNFERRAAKNVYEEKRN